MAKNYYQSRKHDPIFRARLAARAKAWRTKKKIDDPDYGRRENILKRRAERARIAAGLEHKNRKKGVKSRILKKVRLRSRRSGVACSLRVADIFWPSHCPVLGLKLDYDTPPGRRQANKPDLPSIDRWDNNKGYTTENIRVISLRANQIKSNATATELAAVAAYARAKPIF